MTPGIANCSTIEPVGECVLAGMLVGAVVCLRYSYINKDSPPWAFDWLTPTCVLGGAAVGLAAGLIWRWTQ